MITLKSTARVTFFLIILLMTGTSQSMALDLFKKKPVNEKERIETIERIQDVQEKLKLLQDKLRALERRKAAKEGAVDGASPRAENWQAVDEATSNPGDFGVYSYLLFSGEIDNTAAVGTLEDLILTIETLPESDVPAGLGNRFLVPVEQPQSTINLGRQPYSYALSGTYLKSLGLDKLSPGPVLVSANTPIDPYAATEQPPVLVVNLAGLTPATVKQLLQRWHQYESSVVATSGHPLSGLFMTLLQGAGSTRAEVTTDLLLIDFSIK